jgi:hypothetical protein
MHCCLRQVLSGSDRIGGCLVSVCCIIIHGTECFSQIDLGVAHHALPRVPHICNCKLLANFLLRSCVFTKVQSCAFFPGKCVDVGPRLRWGPWTLCLEHLPPGVHARARSRIHTQVYEHMRARSHAPTGKLAHTHTHTQTHTHQVMFCAKETSPQFDVLA